MYKYTAFANEIAGAVSLHPKTKWEYPHHTTSFNQEIIKTVIDLIALVSISMLAVDKYEKTKDKKYALATALGCLIVAYAIPGLFLHRFIERFFSTYSPVAKVGIAMIVIFILYKIEPNVVHMIKNMIK